MRSLPFAALALAALVASACSGVEGPLGPGDPAALVGPTWRLVSLDGRAALPGVPVTAVFAADGRVAGRGGCNQYFGQVVVTGPQLEVGPVGATLMACAAEDVMRQERDYFAALEAAKVYRVSGADLLLGPSAGVVTLVFRAE